METPNPAPKAPTIEEWVAEQPVGQLKKAAERVGIDPGDDPAAAIFAEVANPTRTTTREKIASAIDAGDGTAAVDLIASARLLF